LEWLFQAFETDNLDIVESLIYNRINTNEKSIHGNSPLFLALKINNIRNYKEEECQNKNNVKIINYLIKNNADVNEILKNGDSLLMCTIKYNNKCIVKNLITYCTNIYYKNNKSGGDSPISIAIKSSHNELIKYIMEYSQLHSPTPNNPNNHFHNYNNILLNSNLIDLAIENCNKEVTKYLIEKGVIIDNKICIANALYMDYDDNTIKYLIDNGADINKKGSCKKIPLILAIENRNEALLKYLVEHGATINRSDISLLLSVAIRNSISKSTLQYLIDNIIKTVGTLKNEDDVHNLSPLLCAIKKNDESLVKILLDNGLDINYNKDSSNVSPLSIAFRDKNETIIKYLLEHGTYINSKLDNKTPLSLALLNLMSLL